MKFTTQGEMPEYTEDYNNRVIQNADIPKTGVSMEDVIQELLILVKGHQYVKRNYVIDNYGETLQGI